MYRSALLSLLPAIYIFAQAPAPEGSGNLSLSAYNVLLNARERTAEVMLTNRGTAKAAYRIRFVEMDMNEKGEVEERPKQPGELTASDLVRFTPKQIELAPNESQTLRLQMRKPADLPDGEYRSHLLFQSLPRVGETESPTALKDDALSVSIKFQVSVSIPVVVRHGTTTMEGWLSDLQLLQPETPDSPPKLTLKLHRKGNRTLVGSFKIFFSPKGGPEILVGQNEAVAVYCNIEAVNCTLTLDKLALEKLKGQPLEGGRLKAIFTLRDGKTPTSEAVLDLP